MFFGKSLLVLILVFRNCYLKEVATNTRPWGQEISIQNCHLELHIDISSIEKNKGPSPSVYPKVGYHCFHQSHHCISLGSGPLPLDVNSPWALTQPLSFHVLLTNVLASDQESNQSWSEMSRTSVYKIVKLRWYVIGMDTSRESCLLGVSKGYPKETIKLPFLQYSTNISFSEC
jgi:hypothetical protein